jgi:hypothetical protein
MDGTRIMPLHGFRALGLPSPLNIVEGGLTLYLDAGNTASYPGSGTAWTDLSGNSNSGTLTNGPTFNSDNQGSIVFDGTNDYVNFASYSQPAYGTTTSFTWNIWVYPTRNSNGDLLMGNRGADLDFTKLTTNNFEYYPDNFGGAMPLNVWQNVCVVKNETNLFYYRNSSLIESGTSSSTKPSKPFYVGGDPISLEFSISRISQVLVYNRALSISEIAQNFNSVRGRYGI